MRRNSANLGGNMGKNIMICFDGTGNSLDDYKYRDVDRNITNIAKLHILFGGNLNNTTKTNRQHSFYYSGIGTRGNCLSNMLNKLVAPTMLEAQSILDKAGNDLAMNYSKLNGDKIFVFGFSRGAALARQFCSRIDNYIPVDEGRKPVTLLAAFDTVAAFGVPNLNSDKKPKSDIVFEDCKISPFIKNAIHMVAKDERRVAFQPTLMEHDSNVYEVWFPGAHSDIGGGFGEDGLSDITLNFLLNEIRKHYKYVVINNPLYINYSKFNDKNQKNTIRYSDIQITPDFRDLIHTKNRTPLFGRLTLEDRDIRVLSSYDTAIHIPKVHYSVIQRFSYMPDYPINIFGNIGFEKVGF